MMLDNWGEPIPDTVFDKMERRVVEPHELRQLAGRSERFTAMLAKHRGGDTIIWYTSADDMWAANMGSEGYALIRNGYLVDDVLMKMN